MLLMNNGEGIGFKRLVTIQASQVTILKKISPVAIYNLVQTAVLLWRKSTKTGKRKSEPGKLTCM